MLRGFLWVRQAFRRVIYHELKTLGYSESSACTIAFVDLGKVTDQF